MNRLVIIGNGFDIAHGLKTSYVDFINWYWEQRVDGFVGNISKISEDCRCKLSIKENPNLTQLLRFILVFLANQRFVFLTCFTVFYKF